MKLLACGCEPNCSDLKTGEVNTCLHGTKELVEVDLSGREARCTSCSRTTPSDKPLPGYTCIPFFVYTPDKKFDSMYCGCRGWD